LFLPLTYTENPRSCTDKKIMKARGDWDYALHIKGVSKQTLDLARLAEYLYEFAQLLGKSANARFAGIVNGSAVIRAKELGDKPQVTRSRLMSAASNDESSVRAPYQKILTMMRENGARGEIIDRHNSVLVKFETSTVANDLAHDVLMYDEAEIDGVVVGITGADDTAHVKLQVSAKTSYKLLVRDMSIARKLASHFRGETVRVHVHGKWKLAENGSWEPHSLYIDRVEDLDQRNPEEVMKELFAIKGNAWSEMANPYGYWEKIRGLNDSGD